MKILYNISSLILVCGSLLFHDIHAQTTVNYTTAGSHTLVLPAGVTTMTVTVWGAGGGGGGENGTTDGAGGGGGGACSKSVFVSPAAGNYSAFVGSPGAAGVAGGDGGDGTGSWFINATTLFAEGGKGGLRRDFNGGEGGAGGLAVNGYGDNTYDGGNGANGNDANNGRGGAGGGAGGDSGNGGNASAATTTYSAVAGVGGTNGGGAGGAGGQTGVGVAGTAPGGGASGAGESGNTGGAGAVGRVTITYCVGNVTTWTGGASWSTATWSNGVPTACSSVILPAGCTLNGNVTTSIENLTIQNGATLTGNSPITIGGIFTIDNGGTYIHATATVAATSIFAGAESFGANSNIVVNNWSSGATPFASAISGDIGNLTLNYNAVWAQDGEFSNHTIQGDLLVSTGSINFDDINASTALTIGGTVTLNGAGTHSIFSGNNLPATYTLTTGAITLAAGCNFYMFPAAGADGQSVAITINTNGDWNLSGDFYVATSCINLTMFGCTQDVEYDITCNVTGDINLTMASGGAANFDVVYLAVGDCDVDMNVTGDINCTAMQGWYHYVDYECTGDVTIDCANMVIAAGADNDFRKGTGTIDITCTGSFTHSGATTVTNVSDEETGAVTINVGSDFNMTSGTFRATRGYGNVDFTTGGVFNQDAGIFYGVDHNVVGDENAVTTFNLNSVDFDGGDCIIHNNSVLNGATCLLNVTNDFDVNFTAGTDNFICLNIVGGAIDAIHDFNVGGNFSVSGNDAAFFITSGTLGNETIDIVGNMSVSGGLVWFNGNETVGLSHNNVFNIGGNVAVSGGLLLFSGQDGTNDINVTGNFTVSGGEVIVKDEDGTSTLDIAGNFSQSSGTMYVHKENDVANGTADVGAVTVEGTFSHTGGIYDFDPNTSSTATHTLTLNGSSIILGPGGFIQHASPETGTVFGEIYVNPSSGTTTYDRVSNVHRILQTKIILNAGKVMNATSSVSNIQIAANNAADDVIPAATIMLDIFGNLILGDTRVFGRSSSASFSPTSIIVESGGEIQLTRAQGMYNGANNASIMSRSFNSANSPNIINSTNWFLAPNSRITYNGSANQVVTGKFPANLTTATTSDVVLATNAGYHYYDLEIDHQGTIGTNFVYPSASNVFVRNQLDMDRGEFRLDGSGTGYMINIENPATTGIALTGAAGDAYIRSETNLGTNPSIVRWYVGTTTGAHIVPFGHSAGINNYVPFTFDVNSGGAAGSYVDMSTRATDDGSVANNKDNNPRETSVTNMFSPTLGQDGATEAVIDRWWQIDVSTNYDADITFTYRGVENTLDAPYNIADVGAQRWDGAEWQPDNANWGATASVLAGTGTVTVPGVVAFSPWVLSSISSPLPAKIVSFQGKEEEKYNQLEWEVESEINVSHYFVESSSDGVNFETTGNTSAFGNTSITTTYEYKDYDYYSPITYYRLITVDNNGNEEKSDVVALTREGMSDSWGVYIYPNPSYGELTVDINMLENEFVNIKVLNVLGQTLYNQVVNCVEGQNVTRHDLSILPSGLYHIELSTINQYKVLQFIKQ